MDAYMRPAVLFSLLIQMRAREGFAGLLCFSCIFRDYFYRTGRVARVGIIERTDLVITEICIFAKRERKSTKKLRV